MNDSETHEIGDYMVSLASTDGASICLPKMTKDDAYAVQEEFARQLVKYDKWRQDARYRNVIKLHRDSDLLYVTVVNTATVSMTPHWLPRLEKEVS